MENFYTTLAEVLGELRKSIVLGSCYVSDYENCYNISENECCEFFEGYLEYLEELQQDGYNSEDNIENLCAWYYCFDNDVLGIRTIVEQIQNNELEGKGM